MSSKYLRTLNEYSVWTFAKQETNFDMCFKAVQLFNDIKDINNIKIENEFFMKHKKYGINTNRHRILSTSQLYGLLTKTPFYKRGTQYKNEKPTNVFYNLNKHQIGSREYNELKTEQIIKFKIRAITDTTENNKDYNVLPVVFIYQVLKKLKDDHEILSLHKDILFTYVMTASNYSNLDDVINYIVQNGETYKNINIYQDLSRVLTAITTNINLFNIVEDRISINSTYEEYFLKNFINQHDIKEMHDNLSNDEKYYDFLYNIQGFNINLIDQINFPKQYVVDEKKYDINSNRIESFDEFEYIEAVNSVQEYKSKNILAENAHNLAPYSQDNSYGSKSRSNPIFGKIAIEKANYFCEISNEHITFKSKNTKENFMEGHHLIPMKYQKEIWDNYMINIDCVENIVSLCPNCHRAIHYGDDKTRNEIIEFLYYERISLLNKIGLNISLEELKKMYNL